MFDNYLHDLERIIESTGEPLEGNCFYMDNSFTRSDALLPKQLNLLRASVFGDRILEIGFNAGHSALLFLLGNPNATLTCFDLGQHAYSRPCAQYLQDLFPERLTVIWGDSRKTLPTYIMNYLSQDKFDLVHIDGGHDTEVVLSDVRYSKLIAKPTAYVIYDDIWLPHLAGVYVNQLLGKYVTTVNDEFHATPQYTHQLCRFIPSSIAVCTLSIGSEFREVTKYSLLTKIHYCAKYNMDLIMDNSLYDESRPAAWTKIRVMQTYLPKYDYLWWIDADTYIMNPDIPPAHFIINNRLYHDRHMLLSHDWKMINTGVWIVRNTRFSKEFLAAIYEQDHHINDGNWEQTAFIELYEDNTDKAKERIHVIYHIDFNSYWFNYEWGHFLIHFCGCRKLPALRTVMESYCPLQREDEDESAYKARMHWIEFESKEDAERRLGAT